MFLDQIEVLIIFQGLLEVRVQSQDLLAMSVDQVLQEAHHHDLQAQVEPEDKFYISFN